MEAVQQVPAQGNTTRQLRKPVFIAMSALEPGTRAALLCAVEGLKEVAGT